MGFSLKGFNKSDEKWEGIGGGNVASVTWKLSFNVSSAIPAMIIWKLVSVLTMGFKSTGIRERRGTLPLFQEETDLHVNHLGGPDEQPISLPVGPTSHPAKYVA